MKRLFITLIFTSVTLLQAKVIHFTKYVPVYKSVAIYRVITTREPYEECWEERIPVQEESDDTLGALVGGAAGGILGHQIGRGGGRTAATVGGAIIGTLIGKNLANRSYGSSRYSTQRRCETRYKEHQERRRMYKNFAKVMGRRVVKYSDEPLESIEVHITLRY